MSLIICHGANPGVIFDHKTWDEVLSSALQAVSEEYLYEEQLEQALVVARRIFPFGVRYYLANNCFETIIVMGNNNRYWMSIYLLYSMIRISPTIAKLNYRLLEELTRPEILEHLLLKDPSNLENFVTLVNQLRDNPLSAGQPWWTPDWLDKKFDISCDIDGEN